MKKATMIKHLAEEIIDCIYDNNLNRREATKYIKDVLCEAFCNNTGDYLKSQKCDHGISLSKECYKCNAI